MKSIHSIIQTACLHACRVRQQRRAGPAAFSALAAALLMLTSAHPASAEPGEADIDATYFHPAASLYIEGDSAGASNLVARGLALFPDDGKLKRLKELLDQQQQQDQQQDQQKQQDQQQDQQQQNPDQKDDQQDQQQDQQQNPYQKDDQQQQDQQAAEPLTAEEMSRDEAEQLLDAMRQEEQNKRLQMHPVFGAPVRVDKDW